MRFEDDILKSFKPHFDDFFKDLDRYAEQVFDLMQADQIRVPKGKTLFTSGYYEKGRDWLIECYIAEAQYSGLAGAILSNIDSEQHAEIGGYQRDVVDKLAKAGQALRGARIWRQHVASHVSTFWTFHDAQQRYEKRKKLSQQKLDAQSKLEDDLAKYDRQMSKKVPKHKSSALGAIAAYRKWLAIWNIPDQDKSQLAIWEAEVEEEKRTKLASPDKSAMDEDLFWSIIQIGGAIPIPEKLMDIEKRLTDFTPKAIRDFRKILQSRLSDAYRSDVWALAFLLMNGASDDAFEAFRCWLILAGRKVYTATLSDPNLFDVSLFPGGGCEFALDLMSIPEAAYNRRSKTPLRIARPKKMTLLGPAILEEDFPKLLSRIAKLVDQRV
ncbi:MAG: DUF4240 domain-containing protein [Pseudomonadota bacterium]